MFLEGEQPEVEKLKIFKLSEGVSDHEFWKAINDEEDGEGDDAQPQYGVPETWNCRWSKDA